MKILLVILNIVLIGTCLDAHPTPKEIIPVAPAIKQSYGDGDAYIVSGENAKPGQFPYQAALRMDTKGFCGGSLISNKWVLTAAHCVWPYKVWVVTLGAHNLNDINEKSRITQTSYTAVRHHQYSRYYLANDIGLIKLPKEVAFTNRIKPIALPPKSLQGRNLTDQLTRVSGWGWTSDSSQSIGPTLKYVDLTVITHEMCVRAYGSSVITKTKYCCVGERLKSTCRGDSGGSLTIVNGTSVINIGIISFGHSSCTIGYPTGYTATPYFLDWISNKTGIAIQ